MLNNFVDFLKGLFNRYLQQIVKDYEVAVELYNIKIVRPISLTLRYYLKRYGVFKIIWKIIIIVLIKIPIWWPFLFIVYIWNLFLTYTFLPLIYWIERQITYQTNNVPIWFNFLDYNKFLYWVLEIQWWLKTLLGLVHIMDYLYRWWIRLPRFVDHVRSRIAEWKYDLKQDVMKRDGTIDLALKYFKNNRVKIRNMVIRYIWYMPKNFVFTWLNPHKYKLFRLVFYKRNRIRLYNRWYSWWLIRYKIFKGLTKYRIKSAIHLGIKKLWSRLMFRCKYILKMIIIRCHIRQFYNKIVLKIRKCVYYICKELIYIFTILQLVVEILIIFYVKFEFLFSFIIWIILKVIRIIIYLLYLTLCFLNFWYYNVIYNYDWYHLWFVKDGSNSIKALKLQKKLGHSAENTMANLDLKNKSNSNKNIKNISFIRRIKNNIKLKSNTVWKFCFGQEAILFIDLSSVKDKVSDNSNKKPVKAINEYEDIWTRMWKACCPPLWLEKPEDVNAPNSKYRVEIKAGIGKGKQKSEDKPSKK